MKEVPKYITSIQIQANEMRNINISLGFEKNGAMMLNFQDTAELEQDSSYLNEAAYPNSAVMVYGKYSMWLSMFTRHVKPHNDDQPK
ncbi:MAG: hypothetical protein MPEBLZ_04040 [Candidatus Methanoperedens nitroreducens]|uniref:Uncharacterized protein n=1 Tax=Candidatus Methanoperedens nitratireducens TaxID=1392998 RepID=A0A0P8A4J3_9EURY|nr:hypothetical protein [Candidatus Methanoperedens sp. BLZ2]KAB2945039.1 MAG: hypothetical protein F9K14_12440 [Candidatus Methanoperedens sp.]KPQ41400.1 MAG: hypothetical protein MPEBLZ_04040 [Candidatus Methanoperedens sp. BLZ1]MBZ0176619.1 hypothetical protein [Candidatus Methanoperedens nitroreducens]MCX9080343.1 hypothetical protein [Candidatus Methanoperedens sp.]